MNRDTSIDATHYATDIERGGGAVFAPTARRREMGAFFERPVCRNWLLAARGITYLSVWQHHSRTRLIVVAKSAIVPTLAGSSSITDVRDPMPF